MSGTTDVRFGSRAEEVIEWLSQSGLVRRFKTGEGFFVSKGPLVRLADGTSIDLFDWLSEEGIRGGSVIGAYSIAYSEPDSEFGEKLSFFKVGVVDAPFSRPSPAVVPQPVADDDIPF